MSWWLEKMDIFRISRNFQNIRVIKMLQSLQLLSFGFLFFFCFYARRVFRGYVRLTIVLRGIQVSLLVSQHNSFVNCVGNCKDYLKNVYSTKSCVFNVAYSVLQKLCCHERFINF